jgi:hypothetical protein
LTSLLVAAHLSLNSSMVASGKSSMLPSYILGTQEIGFDRRTDQISEW